MVLNEYVKWVDKYVPKVELEEDEQTGTPKLIKGGKDRFFGLWKRPYVYQKEIYKLPKAIIKYKPKVKIDVKLQLHDF